MNNIEVISEMIQQISNVGEGKTQSKTFLDISGYPHYENVISNILSFLFSTSEEHGLGDLWLKSLVACTPFYDEAKSFQDSIVEREVCTEKGNRIDLYINTIDYSICIENKIYAAFDNDIEDYSEYVKKYNISNKKEVFIILCLNKSEVERKLIGRDRSGFQIVTYEEMFNRLNQYIGDYYLEGSDKWLIYIKDFISTINRLSGDKKDMKDEYRRLYTEENYKILMKINKTSRAYFEQEVKKVAEILDKLVKKKGYKYEGISIYTPKDEIYRDVYFDMYTSNSGSKIAIETRCIFWGWEISLFSRSPKKDRMIIKEFAENNFEIHEPNLETWDNEHFIVKKLGIDLTTEEVALEILKVAQQLVDGGLVM